MIPAPSETGEALLTLDGVCVCYGRKEIVHDLTVGVRPGEVVAIVGHNGAGKSTLLKSIAGGAVRISKGAITYDGRDITRSPAFKRASQGISLVPQTSNTFPDMSIADSLEFSVQLTRCGRHESRARVDSVYQLFPALRTDPAKKARSLSGGQRQMLAIGIALVKQPRIMMLDEPSLGLAPVVVRQVFDSIAEINDRLATTVLLVEQNVKEAARIASRVCVIHTGRLIAEEDRDTFLRRDNYFDVL